MVPRAVRTVMLVAGWGATKNRLYEVWSDTKGTLKKVLVLEILGSRVAALASISAVSDSASGR